MKIVILDGYTENPGDLSWKGFEALGELTVYDRTPLEDEAEILKRIGDAEIVYTNKTPLSVNTIKSCPNLKYIGVLATGYNVVDTKAAKEKGIIVTNIPTYGTACVAQMAIALLLEICQHAGAHSESVKSGKWAESKDFCYWDYPLIELSGKTIGIIGMGRIGITVGQIAKALGMKIIGYDAFVNPEVQKMGFEYVELDDLYRKSDVISLHCPLFDNNKGMINKDSIAKMKNGVILINTSRGPLVNEADLAQALLSGKIYAAGLDVVSSEPIKKDNPLLNIPNCIITPHIAWASKEARERLMNIAVNNLEKFLEGNPINIVNN